MTIFIDWEATQQTRAIADNATLSVDQRMLASTFCELLVPKNQGNKLFVALWVNGKATGGNTGVKMSLHPSGKSVVLENIWDARRGTVLPPYLGDNTRQTTIPIAWLCARGFNAMNTQMRTIDGVLPGKRNRREPHFVVKAFTVWSTSGLREVYTKVVLDIKLCCYVNFDPATGMRLADYNVGQNLGPVRPEQATKGLRGVKFPGNDESACSFVLVDDVEPGLWLFEPPNKFNERYTKIYGNTDGISLGTWSCVVMIDKPYVHGGNSDHQAEVEAALVSGAAYSTGVFDFIGGCRLVSRSLGDKCVIGSPSPFIGGDIDRMDVLTNRSVTKGELNMLLSHTGVVDRASQIKFCVDNPELTDAELCAWAIEQLNVAGLIKTITTYYRGSKVTFKAVRCEEEIFATNIYVLYGKQYSDATEDVMFDEYIEDGVNEESEVKSSYYIDRHEWITDAVSLGLQATSSLPAEVKDDLDNKVIKHRGPVTSMSIRDFSNILFSYCIRKKAGAWVVDKTVLNSVMRQCIADNTVTASKTHRAMHRLLNDGTKGMAVVSKDVLAAMVEEIFNVNVMLHIESLDAYEELSVPVYIDSKGWSRAKPGFDRMTEEQFVGKWNALLKGFETSAGTWPGLNAGMVVKINGEDFMIPPMEFLKASLMPIDKDMTDIETNPEYMFGGAMETVFMLFGAIRTEQKNLAKPEAKELGGGVEWSFNSAQHLIRMNAAMFEDKLNRMMVKGTYLTMVPLFWGRNDEGYAHQVVALASPYGWISYSKEPVIFDKAVVGVNNAKAIPEDVFGGKLSKVHKFAMHSMCFVNIHLMLRQENDTDGDMCCLRYNIKLPLYTVQFAYMDKRVDAYVAKELDFEMKFKRWKFYTKHDLMVGIDGNKTAKENIGLMSANLFQHAMLLELAMTHGGMDPLWAKILWNLYGYIVQDEAMRMIKSVVGVVGSAQSHYYKSTTYGVVFNSRTPIKDMVDGKATEFVYGKPVDSSRLDGFHDKIGNYWAEYDESHKPDLERAIAAYVAYSRKWAGIAYKTRSDGKKPNENPVGGNKTGRIVGSAPFVDAIPLALHIADGYADVHPYKWFNVLQRGYFRHVEEYRLSPSKANSAAAILVDNGVPTDTSRNILFGRKTLEMDIPAIDVFCAAYRVDAKVRQGWVAQHDYIGNNYAHTHSEKGSVIRYWLHMMYLAHKSNVEYAENPEAKVARLAAEEAAMIAKMDPVEAMAYEMKVVRPVVMPDPNKH